MVNSTEKESTFGLMDLVMKGSLCRELGKDKGAGNRLKSMEISMLALMRLTKKTDMVGMFGLMVVFMKVDLPTMSSRYLLIQARKGENYVPGRKRSQRNLGGRQSGKNRQLE